MHWNPHSAEHKDAPETLFTNGVLLTKKKEACIITNFVQREKQEEKRT